MVLYFHFRPFVFLLFSGAMAMRCQTNTPLFIILPKTGAVEERKTCPSHPEAADHFSINALAPEWLQQIRIYSKKACPVFTIETEIYQSFC